MSLTTGPEPEFPDGRHCTRCGMEIPLQREHEQCASCEATRKYHPRGVQGAYLPPFDPAFEVHVHYDTYPKEDPTLGTLEALRIPYVSYTAKRDLLEVTWALGLVNPERAPQWPIVLITSHGEVADFWEGFDLNRLNALSLKRAAAIPPSVPDSQEQAA